MTFLVTQVLQGQIVRGLSAYDCTHPNATGTPLDLLEPEKCKPPNQYYLTETAIRIQLIQTEAARPIQAYTCRMTVSSAVTRCGFDSLTYGTHHPYTHRQVAIPPALCRRAVKDKRMYYEAQEIPIKIGRPTIQSFYAHGRVETNGACKTEDFIAGGISFKKSYEKKTVSVTVTSTKGTVNQNNAAVFTNGLRAPYQDMVIRDDKIGTMVWEVDTPKCHQSISEIYLGEAKLFVHSNSSTNSIVLLSDNATSQYGGFLLKGTRSLCDVHVHTTQVPNLVILTLRPGDSPIPHSSFKDRLEQTKVSLMSHLAYLHVRTNQDVADQFHQVYKSLCEIDSNSLENRLRMVAEDNRKTAIDIFGPGYSVVAAGEVAYVIKCVKVEVKTRHQVNCTRDLPIAYGVNFTQVGYRSPITHEIIQYSAPIPCDPINPPMHRIDINGKPAWYCLLPTLTPCQAPLKLDPTVEFQISERDYGAELGHRLYTDFQEKAHIQAMFLLTS